MNWLTQKCLEEQEGSEREVERRVQNDAWETLAQPRRDREVEAA
jgi:hypothetical protein